MCIKQSLINVYMNTNDYAKDAFKLPEYVEKLIREGRLGFKTKEGLYKTIQTETGKKRYCVYDIMTDQYREIKNYDIPFAFSMIKDFSEGFVWRCNGETSDDYSEEGKICKKFMVEYVIYSLHINREVGYTGYDADDTMAAGFSSDSAACSNRKFWRQGRIRENSKSRIDRKKNGTKWMLIHC